MRGARRIALVLTAWLASAGSAAAADGIELSLKLGEEAGGDGVAPAVKMLLALTAITLAPALLISMTAFTRIVIVLAFVRQAVGTQNIPPTQVLLGLSLALTFVVMAPTAKRLHAEVIAPYDAQALTSSAALEKGQRVMADFLVRQTRDRDLWMFHELTQTPRPSTVDAIPFHLLVPAFMVSELRTGFEMGFLLLLPFVLVDLLVASILTSMGMVMMPPTVVSAPLKVLVFILVDGWALLCRSLVTSFL